MKKYGEFYWHNNKVALMFILAKLFGKTYIGHDVNYEGNGCKLTMKYFSGKYYVIKEEFT